MTLISIAHIFMSEGIKITNILLDKLPQDYEGYLIRTDFGIGIQMTLCASDPDIPEHEKVAIILNLLFGRGVPDFEMAMRGARWFMSCGKAGQEESAADDVAEPPALSFEVDDARIYSAFKRVFGIDLNKDRLHWFSFISMLQDIEGSALADVIGYRRADLSKMKGEQRAAYAEMKRKFALPSTYSEEEREAIKKFSAALGDETI